MSSTSAAMRTPQPDRLGSLPFDILLMVTDLLDPVGTAMLSFTSRRVYAKLGNRFLSLFKYGNSETFESYTLFHEAREEAFTLVAKDLDDYIFCRMCRKVQHFQMRQRWWGGWTCGYEDETRSFYHSEFGWVRLQLAMKLYHAKKDYQKHINALSWHWKPSEQYDRSIQLRVIQDHVLLKDEHRITLNGVLILGYDLRFCMHIKPSQEAYNRTTTFMRHIEQLLASCETKETRTNTQEVIFPCDICNTEISIKCTRNTTKETELRITAWKDIGSCASLLRITETRTLEHPMKYGKANGIRDRWRKYGPVLQSNDGSESGAAEQEMKALVEVFAAMASMAQEEDVARKATAAKKKSTLRKKAVSRTSVPEKVSAKSVPQKKSVNTTSRTIIAQATALKKIRYGKFTILADDSSDEDESSDRHSEDIFERGRKGFGWRRGGCSWAREELRWRRDDYEWR